MWHVHPANVQHIKRGVFITLGLWFFVSCTCRTVVVVERRYVFLKRLCQVLCALGGQLCALVASSCITFCACVIAKACQPYFLKKHHILLTGFRCGGWSTCKYQQVHGGSFGLHHTFQSGETTTVFSDGQVSMLF